MDGIKDIHIVSDDYKLVSKKWKVNATTIDLGDGIVIEDGGFQIMAGPCSIEGEDQIRKTIAHLKENGVSIMRGGCSSREVLLMPSVEWESRDWSFGIN